MRRTILVAMLLSACGGTQIDEVIVSCVVELELGAEQARVGDTVTATGGPLTSNFDTRVQVGGVYSDAIEVERTDCGACEACISEFSCGACATECASCTETVTFEIPALQPGPRAVVLYNRHGSTEPITLEILASVDTDVSLETDPPADTSTPDTANPTDTADTDPADTDPTDSDTDPSPADTDPPAP